MLTAFILTYLNFMIAFKLYECEVKTVNEKHWIEFFPWKA